MENIWQEIRFSLRRFKKNPGFTVVAVLTLALGIGANSAIFSVVNAVLLRPMPYPHSERLIKFRSNQSVLDLQDVEENSKSFDSVGGVVLQPLDYTGGTEPVQVQSGLITAGLLETLGAQPLLGRLFSHSDDRFNGDRTVVLSYGFWQRQFGGNSGIVGKAIPLSGNSYTVIGILPAAFELPIDKAEAYALVRIANPIAAKVRGVQFLQTFGLLKSGVSISQGQAEVNIVDQMIAEKDPDTSKGRHSTLVVLQEAVVGKTKPAVLVLFGAVALVLLIASTNFANLLLSRAAARRQEFVIRVAMGAKRGALMRQMITESLLLSLVGGVVGLLLAVWGVQILLALAPKDLPRLTDVSVDLPVVLFTFVLSVLTGLLFGLIPAWASANPRIYETLKNASRSASSGVSRQRLRRALVVFELGLALVLFIAAGLLIRAFVNLNSVVPGFATENIVTMRIELPEAGYTEIPPQTRFRISLLDAINAQPNVHAAMISETPLSGQWLYHGLLVQGGPVLLPSEAHEIHSRSVAGDYFHIMQIPVLKGRAFTRNDSDGSPLVAMINQAGVRKFFPNEDPVGKQVRWASEDEPHWMTIVGIAGDVKHFGLDQPEQAALYTPYAQMSSFWKRWTMLVVSSELSPSVVVPMVQKEVWKLDKQLPITKIHTMQELTSSSLARNKFMMLLVGIFAGVALVLAVVGIYGVISYSVIQRTHEIGIRMALGAEKRQILELVLGEGMLLVSIGVLCGWAGAFAATRWMATLLFGVSPIDAPTFLGVAAILSVVALLATYVPAMRAGRIDPIQAIRYE